jgi:hypothetical protein
MAKWPLILRTAHVHCYRCDADIGVADDGGCVGFGHGNGNYVLKCKCGVVNSYDMTNDAALLAGLDENGCDEDLRQTHARMREWWADRDSQAEQLAARARAMKGTGRGKRLNVTPDEVIEISQQMQKPAQPENAFEMPFDLAAQINQELNK